MPRLDANKKQSPEKTDERLAEKGRLLTLRLREIYPEARCALEYGGDAWRLLVMARLSAQCTDERVNIVCRRLFDTFPDARSMAAAPILK